MKNRVGAVPGVLRGPGLGLAPPSIAPPGQHDDYQQDPGDDVAGTVHKPGRYLTKPR